MVNASLPFFFFFFSNSTRERVEKVEKVEKVFFGRVLFLREIYISKNL